MKKILKAIVLAGFLTGLVPPANSGERGTAEEAVAMVKKAAELIRTKGREKAFVQFNNPTGPFVDRDLYIAVIDGEGTMLSHGANPKLIGKMLIELRDADGNKFIKALVDTAKNKGSGWVDYKWPSPVSKAIEAKSTYVERVNDLSVVCGIYK